MVDMGCFASMVGDKEDLTSHIGLSNLATGLQKGTAVMTNLEMGVETDFAMYYNVEYCTADTEKKRLGMKTYQFVAAATDDAG